MDIRKLWGCWSKGYSSWKKHRADVAVQTDTHRQSCWGGAWQVELWIKSRRKLWDPACRAPFSRGGQAGRRVRPQLSLSQGPGLGLGLPAWAGHSDCGAGVSPREGLRAWAACAAAAGGASEALCLYGFIFEGDGVLKEPDVLKNVCISLLNLSGLSDWQCIVNWEVSLLGTKQHPWSWQQRVCWREVCHTKSFPFLEPKGHEFTSCLASREIPVFLSCGEQIRGCSSRSLGDCWFMSLLNEVFAYCGVGSR